METFSALLAICAGNSPVPGEFPTLRPVTRGCDVFFDLRPNNRLSKQWWSWWVETPTCPLWRHRNDMWIPFPQFKSVWQHNAELNKNVEHLADHLGDFAIYSHMVAGLIQNEKGLDNTTAWPAVFLKKSQEMQINVWVFSQKFSKSKVDIHPCNELHNGAMTWERFPHYYLWLGNYGFSSPSGCITGLWFCLLSIRLWMCCHTNSRSGGYLRRHNVHVTSL